MKKQYGIHICKRTRLFLWLVLVGFMAGAFIPDTGYAGKRDSNRPIPEGAYIDLTRQYYKALTERGDSGTRTYSNDPSKEILRQLSISAKFMVETNLQIIRQQEIMIQLLQAMLEKTKQ